jgi:alpha-N-arabinofuranosidase
VSLESFNKLFGVKSRLRRVARTALPILALTGAYAELGLSRNTFARKPRADALVEIDASAVAAYRIPRTIYGTFLEPIGKSIYPGLWAQLLENPSFEDNLWSFTRMRAEVEREPDLAAASSLGLPLPWEPLDRTQGNRYEPRWDQAANSARSLLIMGLPAKQTGVRQQTWLPIHRTPAYGGSLWARHVSGPAAVEVSLRRRKRPDEVLVGHSLRLQGESWAKYTFQLDLPPGKLASLEPADFVIAVDGPTRVLIDQALLFPSDALHGMDPEMVAMSKALKTPVVRFGGNFTSGYHWRDGIGPMDKRPSMLNQAWGMPEYNHFGTDEYLEFCRLAGAEPQICLNLGTGTPEEAADWVRYVNDRWNGGRGGLLWELGNELWGTFQIGYPTIDEIAERTRVFSEAVRRVDPGARLIATGGDPDHDPEWNRRQLTDAPDAFQYLATHFVVGAGTLVESQSRELMLKSAYALPIGLERRLREMHSRIEAHPHARGKVKLAFTEWLFHGRDRQTPRFDNMGGAVLAAGFLNALIRVADITPIADMTGLIEFGGIWKKRGRVYGVPAYWAFRMYSTADATLPVDTTVTADGYDVRRGNRRISEIENVPYLDVVAALNDARSRLTLFCVNRHLTADIPAKIGWKNFSASAANVQTLAANEFSDANDETAPEAVVPTRSTALVQPHSIEHRFPRSSVTVIELR